MLALSNRETLLGYDKVQLFLLYMFYFIYSNKLNDPQIITLSEFVNKNNFQYKVEKFTWFNSSLLPSKLIM